METFKMHEQKMDWKSRNMAAMLTMFELCGCFTLLVGWLVGWGLTALLTQN